jgi:hypothetical protein
MINAHVKWVCFVMLCKLSKYTWIRRLYNFSIFKFSIKHKLFIWNFQTDCQESVKKAKVNVNIYIFFVYTLFNLSCSITCILFHQNCFLCLIKWIYVRRVVWCIYDVYIGVYIQRISIKKSLATTITITIIPSILCNIVKKKHCIIHLRHSFLIFFSLIQFVIINFNLYMDWVDNILLC